MRLLELGLTNIGPFNTATLRLLTEESDSRRVALLTGQNGTGKSIVIDAIRALFGPPGCDLERNIARSGFRITASFKAPQVESSITVSKPHDATNFHTPLAYVLRDFELDASKEAPPWVIDFWRSSIATDEHRISSLVTVNHRAYLSGALQGIARNAATTELIAHFDYLRDSRDPKEKATGDALYGAMVQIIDSSLLEGRFVRVERSTFTPIVHQSGFDVPLENVSSGNAYLIQRMIGLLGKMYSLHVLRRTDPADICKASGLLLIDEAENHLHPRWQKKFIPTILSVFPNLQLVASTHSPFIVSSVPNARVFTCTYDSAARACSVREENEEFARKPVDEILLTDAFAETQPFGPKITALLEERKAAIEAGDEATQLAAEEKLLQENPEAFRAFAIDRILAKDARK